MKTAGIFLFGLLLAFEAAAQRSSDQDSTRWLGVPVVFRTPETGWGIGAAAMHTRHFGPVQTTPPSQFQLGAAFTQERQLLVYLPFQIYAADDAFRFKGEVGYYRYSYFYYGLGNDQQAPEGERFFVSYPRLRLDVLKPLKPGLFAGLRYWYEDYQMDTSRREPNGYFDSGSVPGGDGSRVSGLGGVVVWDRRDHVMNARTGTYLEASYQHFAEALGGNVAFDRYRVDVRWYGTWLEKNTLASRVWLEHGAGNIPFQQLAVMGGSNRMRGFYEGRFRDKNIAIWQGEYRRRFRERWTAVAFSSLGLMAPAVDDFQIKHLRSTYGAGLRFGLDADARMNVRFDVGVGEGQLQTYFTFLEAF